MFIFFFFNFIWIKYSNIWARACERNRGGRKGERERAQRRSRPPCEWRGLLGVERGGCNGMRSDLEYSPAPGRGRAVSYGGHGRVSGPQLPKPSLPQQLQGEAAREARRMWPATCPLPSALPRLGSPRPLQRLNIMEASSPGNISCDAQSFSRKYRPQFPWTSVDTLSEGCCSLVQ